MDVIRQPVLERFTLDLLAAPKTPIVVMRQQLGEVAVHWHDFYELVFVLSGESSHVCNGRDQLVRAGSSMLLSPSDFHGFRQRSAEPLVCYNVVIDPWVAERHLGELLRSEHAMRPWAVDDYAEAHADFDRLWTESRERQAGADQVMDAVLSCILVGFARKLVHAELVTPVVDDDPVRRALFFIDQHFREPLSLAEVAAQAYLSPNYFSARFHELTGISFQGYVQQCRLRFARSLLAATGMPVTDAALAAGFNSPSHFGRAYRARYGCSPSGDRGPAGAGMRPSTVMVE